MIRVYLWLFSCFLYIKYNEREGEGMGTKTGIIVMLKKNKGYGFIKPEDSEINIFFHASGVLSPKFEELKNSERVEYLDVETPKGKKAIDVVVA